MSQNEESSLPLDASPVFRPLLVSLQDGLDGVCAREAACGAAALGLAAVGQ